MKQKQSKPHLTHRMLQCLALACYDYQKKEIAGILGISEKTVQKHVTWAYQILGIQSRIGAMWWMLQNGFLIYPLRVGNNIPGTISSDFIIWLKPHIEKQQKRHSHYGNLQRAV